MKEISELLKTVYEKISGFNPNYYDNRLLLVVYRTLFRLQKNIRKTLNWVFLKYPHYPSFYLFLAYLAVAFTFYKLLEMPYLARSMVLPWPVALFVMFIFYLHAFTGLRTVIGDYTFDKPMRSLFLVLVTILFLKSLFDISSFHSFLISQKPHIGQITPKWFFDPMDTFENLPLPFRRLDYWNNEILTWKPAFVKIASAVRDRWL